MRRAVTSFTVSVLVLALVAGLSQASHSGAEGPPRDFAVGGGTAGPLESDNPNPPDPTNTVHFSFSAHQTEGLFAKGHIRVDQPPFGAVQADVLCLNIIDDRAFIIGEVTSGPSAATPFILVEAFDSDLPGGQGDEFRHTFVSENAVPPSGSCVREPPFVRHLQHGNIVVHDALP